MHKRGQSGSGAATLVLIITGLIILYVLFLPADVREDLLEGNESQGNILGEDKNLTLLWESPGRLDYLKLDEYEHNIPSVYLSTSTSSQMLKRINSVYVRNGMFDTQFKNTTFSADDVENLDNILLTFSATKRRGTLSVLLNGETVYEAPLASQTPPPIHLEKRLLRQENTLEFRVSGVGWRFWSTNEYVLEDVMIVGDVTDITQQKSRNVFTLSDTEHYNLNEARLVFLPDCTPSAVGTLNVYINNRNIYSAKPDCGSLRPIEFSTSLLNAGENNVVFSSEKGSFLIDRIAVKTELKEIVYPVYYFDINSSLIRDIMDDRVDVNLSIEFIDDNKNKRVELNVNGHRTFIETDEPLYSRLLDRYVEERNNWIQFIPYRDAIDIVEFRVILEEKD
ncbi:hypothetical protein JXB02_03565 [Candidatus Woesearchaeota archaeon]|nr:hypothetical protein [Candidatus Woesearchaeota archaeon]